MGKPATAAKNRWNKKTYVRYGITVNRTTEADILEYIERKKEEGISVTSLFKDALRREMEGDSWYL